MLKLSFHQTRAEIMVRAAATLIFNALTRTGHPLVPLSSLTEYPQYGFTASATPAPVGPKFVRITDLQDASIDWDTVPYCDCEGPDKYLLQPYDLLFARTGATTGKTHLVVQCPRAVFASYLIRLRPKPIALAEYLYSFFQSDNYWSQISDSKEGSAQPNVNGRKLMNIAVPLVDSQIQSAIRGFVKVVRERQEGLDVPLPELPSPLDEQRRIVSRIEELAAKIEAAARLRRDAIDEADALIQSAKSTCLSNLLDRFGGEPLGGLVTMASGEGLTSSEMDDALGFPVYGGGGLTGRFSRYMFEEPKIVIGRVGARCGCVFVTEPKAWVTDNALYLKTMSPRLVEKYLVHALANLDLRQQANQAAQPVVSQKRINPMQIPVPPLEEQNRVVTYLDQLQSRVDLLNKLQSETAAEIDALMPSILSKAFRGEL